MALQNNNTQGLNPQGNKVDLPIAGIVTHTETPLKANEQWQSDIIPYNGNESVHFALSTDVPGSYTVEYFNNGEKAGFMGNPTQFDPNVVGSLQGALAGKGDSFRITYLNGATAQTAFYLEIRLGQDVQETKRSIGIPVGATNLAGTTHSVIEGREGLTGNYKQATISQVGGKIALDVNVINRTNEAQKVAVINDAPLKVELTNQNEQLDTSALAKDATLTDGSQKTAVTNLPNDYATAEDIQTLADTFSSLLGGTLSVEVANPMGATDVSGLAQEQTLQSLLDAYNGSDAGDKLTAANTLLQGILSALGGALSVTVSNPTAATDVSALAKDITLTNGNQKTLITNADYAKTVDIQSVVTNLQGLATLLSGVLKVDIQDTDYAKDSTIGAGNTLLTAIRDKLIASPATEASLGAILAKLQSSIAVTGTFWQATQPVSALALPLPPGASTAAKQDSGNSSLASIDTKTTLDADGGIKVHVQNPATGGSTSALQSAGNTSLASIDTKIPGVGQKASAASLPVVLSSDQTLPLPNGAATATKQDIGNTTLGSIDAKTTLDADGGIKVHLQNPISGGSTSALQTAGNTSLSSIDSKIPAIGQKAAAASLPVVLSSDQALPLPAGASTAARQDTANTSLGAINTSIGTQADAYQTDPTVAASLMACIKGLLYETPGQATTGSVGPNSAIVANTTTTLMPANANRKGGCIFSESGTILIFLGAGASATQYTQRIVTNGYYELPYYYTGIVTAFSTTASTVRVTILT